MIIKDGNQSTIMQTRVAGVSYEGRQRHIEAMTEDTPVYLKRERDNPHDENAVEVISCFPSGEVKIGYLPRDVAAEIAPLMDDGEFVFVQFLERKKEEYSIIDYETGERKEWGFMGVILGIMY